MQRSWSLLLSAALLLIALAVKAQVAPPRTGPATVSLEAFPILGTNAPTSPGWMTFAVRLDNPADARVEGNLELSSEVYGSGDTYRSVTRAPFSAAGRSVVTVQLPTHGYGPLPPSLSVRALDTAGQKLAETEVPALGLPGPLLVDLNTPSRIAPAVRGTGIPVTSRRGIRGSYGAPTVTVSSPQVNAATGDPVLPQRAAGYSSATVVLARSERLAKLQGVELTALADWVLGGGSLAVVVTRPEDLRGGPLEALLGGRALPADPPPSLLAAQVFEVVPDPATGGRGHGHGAPSSTRMQRAAPGQRVAADLVGYRGGNLRPSAWGASASYGLGEVHLLAFDATREPHVSDTWVRLQILSLLQHSWDRRADVVLPHAALGLEESGVREVRRKLDPNEGTRWAIAVAALLLLLYAVLAGPVNFYWAARKGRPLRALGTLPIWAAVAMAVVVLLGMAAKGIRGRARHVSLIEAGAGMGRAAVVRFRGFYAASADRLTVRAFERGGVLDVASREDQTQRTLVLDRDGARLEEFRAKPWETVAVREDGFVSLAGGLSVRVAPDGEIAVKNRAARDLVGVLLKVPGQAEPYYFDRIEDGALVKAAAGRRLKGVDLTPAACRALCAPKFAHDLDEASAGLGAAWKALEDAGGYEANWWPSDVPVLLGQLDGGEGRTRDSGLRLDADRVLVRVVGYGGVL